MFLRCAKRIKDGKEHLYWSVVESRRLHDGRVAQRHVLYLGELNGRQEASWRKTVDLLGQDDAAPQQVALFPEQHAPVQTDDDDLPIVRIRLSQMSLRRPRQWGACWLGCELWQMLGLDAFWREHLPPSREGTRWDLVLQTLVLYRLIDPGSEWRLHRHWSDHSAIAESARAAQRPATLRLQPRQAPGYPLAGRACKSSSRSSSRPRVLIRCAHPFGAAYRLSVSLRSAPLAYEVLPGNTTDKTTLKDFLAKIEDQYGKADRVWVMDRGIPAEETLAQMRASTPSISYLVGTPKGKLTTLERALLKRDWQSRQTQRARQAPATR